MQYGVMRSGGCEYAAHIIRAGADESIRTLSGTITVKADVANAFDSASRSHMLIRLLSAPTTSRMCAMRHCAHAASTPLHVRRTTALAATLDSSAWPPVRGRPFAAFARIALCARPLRECAVAPLRVRGPTT